MPFRTPPVAVEDQVFGSQLRRLADRLQAPAVGTLSEVSHPVLNGQAGADPAKGACAARLLQRRLQCQTLYSVLRRRDAQDAQWGGPAHDDTHTAQYWADLLSLHATQVTLPQQEASGFEDKMLDIAALAVAAIESSRRKRGALTEASPSQPMTAKV